MSSFFREHKGLAVALGVLMVGAAAAWFWFAPAPLKASAKKKDGPTKQEYVDEAVGLRRALSELADDAPTLCVESLLEELRGLVGMDKASASVREEWALALVVAYAHALDAADVRVASIRLGELAALVQKEHARSIEQAYAGALDKAYADALDHGDWTGKAEHLAALRALGPDAEAALPLREALVRALYNCHRDACAADDPDRADALLAEIRMVANSPEADPATIERLAPAVFNAYRELEPRLSLPVAKALYLLARFAEEDGNALTASALHEQMESIGWPEHTLILEVSRPAADDA